MPASVEDVQCQLCTIFAAVELGSIAFAPVLELGSAVAAWLPCAPQSSDQPGLQAHCWCWVIAFVVIPVPRKMGDLAYFAAPPRRRALGFSAAEL